MLSSPSTVDKLLLLLLAVPSSAQMAARARGVPSAVPSLNIRAVSNGHAVPMLTPLSSVPSFPSLSPSLSVPAFPAPNSAPADAFAAPAPLAAATLVAPQAAARLSASAAAVQAVVDSGALSERAPAEQGRSGADASFAALTGEPFSARRDGLSAPSSPPPAAPGPSLSAPADAPSPAPAAPPGPKQSDVKVRAVTAAVIIPAQVLLIHAGGAVFAGFVVLLSFQMLRELGAMLEKGGRPVDRAAMTLAGTGVAAAVALGLPVAASLALAAAGVLLREMTGARSPDRAAWTLFGAAVLGALPAFLAPLRALPQGELLTLLAFSAAWAVDTGAYVAGKTLGRHKLAPLVSPGKTWEGSIGGFLAAAATAAAFAWAVPGLLTWPQAAGVALIVGVVGQVSGLANSMIKRAMGVKDSGTLLPGHGGALDRFDTFVLTAALLFALLA